MIEAVSDSHWLDLYNSDCYNWQTVRRDGRTSFYRPLGLVEFCFDADGRYYEGRADISMQTDVALQSTLSKQERQQHMTLAWACLRAKHILTTAKAPIWQAWMHKPAQITHEHCFLIDVPRDVDEAVAHAARHVTFLEEHYDKVDASSFYTQSQNSARVLDSKQALARLFILPPARHHGTETVSCIFIAAHQIGDGLSMSHWVPDFLKFLNMPTDALLKELSGAIRPQTIKEILPKAQESLYPPVKGPRARQRWFWLLTRILRHVRKPLPAGFSNPLLRSNGYNGDFSPQWTDVLSFDKRPLNLSAPIGASMSAEATARMVKICRAAGISIGAGCFALAAILMMEFYERREPSIPEKLRKPFITGFPLNPRPFLTGNPRSDSLMLAFSDGIMLPFLSSTLSLEGRLRLLGKIAQRQLAVYQKRSNIRPDQDGLQYMSSRGAGRMLAIQYLSSFERCELLLPPEKRNGSNPQGKYEMRPNLTRQTCGVSSTGRRAPLNTGVVFENAAFKATAIDAHATVRAREGEFLIGITGAEKGIIAFVSVDGSSVDSALVKAWLHRFQHIMEDASSDARL